MKIKLSAHQLIETPEALNEFYEDNQATPWIAFDSEFIGEKRFYTTICLMQVATPKGIYLIDPIKLQGIEPLLKLLADERILKIVHAASNDYRLIYNHYGVIARNTFDTQIAAAFIGYKYPVAFNKLVENELKLQVGKGFTVTNWEHRPFPQKLLQYAIQDVIHLHSLYASLSGKLSRWGRLDWVFEECQTLEDPEFYEQDPYKETLDSNLIKGLRYRERVMLLRLLLWRTDEARRRDHSKEMVLPGKYISTIVRALQDGMEALRQNRRLPDNLVERYGKIMVDLYQQPVSEEEKDVLSRLPKDGSEEPRVELMMEMLDLLVRYKCLEAGISHQMVLPRNVLKRMKNEPGYFDPALEAGWRNSFLGKEIISWFRNRKDLAIDFTNGKFELKMGERSEAQG